MTTATVQPSTASVRTQLDRLLGSRTFANAPSLAKLLEHLVSHTMEGHRDGLKEYTLGVDVFHRSASFDPRTDTIVRVSARRLRAKLDEYYSSEGRADPVVFELPKGRYNVHYRLRSSPSMPTSRDFQSQGLEVPASRSAFHIPAPRNALIGRESDIDLVRQLLLREDVRLITLTGVGGIGKTRLAAAAAAAVMDEFPGGVSFVSLAGISDPAAVTQLLAQVLELRQTDGKPLADAVNEHARRFVVRPKLLVLDNFEHLLPAASVMAKLLDASRALKMLVTSRAVLRVYGEHDYAVPSLTLPDRGDLESLERLRENPAIALFLARAVAADREFRLTLDNAASVADVCRWLDGLPLAIELAAARVKTLPPRDILARLHRRLNLPGSSHIDTPARQQTLRNTLDWSYGLLDVGEQRLFRRMSVFAGGCTFEGVEAVCNARRDLQVDVMGGISSLLDRSLLQQVESSDGPRFFMIETVREYGMEQLNASGEREAISKAHAAYSLVLAEEGNTAVNSADRRQWLAQCQLDEENFRAALDYLTAGNHAEWAQRLGVALHPFWDRLDHAAEARARLEAILALGDAEARRRHTWALAASYAAGVATVQGDFEAVLRWHRASLQVCRELGEKRRLITELSGTGFAEREHGNYEAARCLFEECVSECRKLGDKWGTAAALSNFAGALQRLGSHLEARAALLEAAEIFRDIGDSSGVAWSWNHFGDIARECGDLVQGMQAYQEGLTIFRHTEDLWGIARSCADLGYLACQRGDYSEAQTWLSEALSSFQALDHQRGIVYVIEGFAALAALQGDADRALMLGGAAAMLGKSTRAARNKSDEELLGGALEMARSQRDPSAAKSLWSVGSSLRLEEAIGIARDVSSPTRS